MNDIRQPGPASPRPPMPSVDLHRRYHEHQAARTASSTPHVEATQTTAPPAPAPPPLAPPEVHPAVDHSLRSIKVGLIVLIILFAGATIFFISQTIMRPAATPDASPSPEQNIENTSTSGVNPISCLSQTGPDLTTQSQSFVDMEGTECTYKTGPTEETLVLSGKLSGRNTEGTGMSATISVNGKDCNGGESLNYARTYTPMLSNCVFVVPANSTAAIKWRFLSPFGGTAAVLRSNKNIAPFISGVGIPKADSRQ